MSNFEFLNTYWPPLSELGSLAEAYVYSDPNACIFKIGLMSEIIVQEIFKLEKIELQPESTHQNNIRLLKRHGLISTHMDDVLFSIRKARNSAVHVGFQPHEKAMVMLEMAHTLSSWFMEVYGDWDYKPTEFIKPYKQDENIDSLKVKLEEQEQTIEELMDKIKRVETAASGISSEEKKEKVINLDKEIHFGESVKYYLEKEKIRLDITIIPTLNLALQQHGINIIRNLSVINNSDRDIDNAILRISTDPDIFETLVFPIDRIPNQETIIIRNAKLSVNTQMLIELTERINGVMKVQLEDNGTVVYEEILEISFLPYDQWHGINYMPELLAMYMTPNHPNISDIILKASDILEEWGYSSSLEGYQKQSNERAKEQISAIYAALKSLNLVYTNPPASFERIGQRIRMPDQVINERVGTCLDLTLLFASVLEAVGMNPILITKPNHIFLGCWLEDLTFSESVEADSTLLNKRIADGINEIILIETTLLTSNTESSFDDAVFTAKQNMSNDVEYIIDVKRARLTNIRPLPIRVKREDGSYGIMLDRSLDIKPEKSQIEISKIDLDIKNLEIKTKIDQWERKLLDLSLRNNLLNLRMTKSLIPLLSHSLSALEEKLSEMKVIDIYPKPLEWHIRQEDLNFDNSNDLGTLDGMIKQELNSRRIRSFLTDIELDNRLKTTYRNARLSFEENGANTLFISFGLLKWYETNQSEKARYAPIVLIPIELKRKAASHAYTVKIRDEEPQINITLLEKLKQDFGIDVTGLDPLPTNENRIDLKRVFTVIRDRIKNLYRWDLIESSFIGIFSFSQFVMWNDLRNRREDLEKNKVVHSLIQGRLTWTPNKTEIKNGSSAEDTILQPLPADSSQLVAIQNALNGESFVLHGPPGTGKSQTITSLIANNLFQGKTVLFIAEKMAALEVVQQRLEAINIGDFCLELHSNKANKRDVLEYFRKITTMERYRSVESFNEKSEDIKARRKELNKYVYELHKQYPNDFTIFQLINEYESYKKYPDLDSFSQEYMNSIDKRIKNKHEQFLEEFVSSARQVGHPFNHPLKDIMLSDYSQSLRESTSKMLEDYSALLDNFMTLFNKLEVTLIYDNDTSFEGLKRLRKILENLAVWEDMPHRWKIEENLYIALNRVRETANEAIKRDNLYDEIVQNWHSDFLELSGNELYDDVKIANEKWFVAKSIALNKIKKSIRNLYEQGKLKNSVIFAEIEKLNRYQKQVEKCKHLIEVNHEFLSDFLNVAQMDWQAIINKVNQALESNQIMYELTKSNEFRIKNSQNISIFEYIDKYATLFEKIINKYMELSDLLKLSTYDEQKWHNHQSFMVKEIKNNLSNLREWVLWNDYKNKAIELGLSNIVDKYHEGADHESIIPMYKKKITQQLSSLMINEVDTLNRFNGVMFNEKIKFFKDLEQDLTELSKIELHHTLSNNLPDLSLEAIGSSEIGILKRAISSNGRGTSIRKLFSSIPNILPKLAPCMLMSPISAAQYLDPSQPLFDLIVFDEASQLPTAKAIGTIARSENAIIVGDPKQMPPTNFFTANVFDEENEEHEDLISILDDAIAISMPEEYLQWHYRSKHESLIAFSNNQFYENRLYTFPSFNDAESRVTFKYINGTFDRGRRRDNKEEAKAIVQELLRRFKDPKLNDKSVGIVTFNSSQQNLIEDLVDSECVNNNKFDDWIDRGNEPLFIKNLENVQGDERDVILFSIGYGPDKEGRIYMNFGPLNRDGGWRRLNVAITRARYEMIVFSSLYPEDIDLNRTNAEGVSALKMFLAYAIENKLHEEDGPKVQSKLYEQDDSKGITDAIANSLKHFGYEVVTNVGKSSFKVDLAVINPKNPNEYILGILLDGTTYKEAKTTRDREVSHVSVLENLEWNVHRIWTLDWREDPEKETSKIIDILSKIENGRPTIKDKGNENREKTNFKTIPVEPNGSYSAKSYISAVLEKQYIDSNELLNNFRLREQKIQKLKDIIRIESPIYEELAFKKLLNSYSISRLGNQLRNDLRNMISMYLEVHSTYEDAREVLWDNDEMVNDQSIFRANTESESRNMSDIPITELTNAANYVLKNYITLNHEDLVRETAKLLGFYRVTNVVRNQVDLAIQAGLNKEYFKLTKENLYVLTEGN